MQTITQKILKDTMYYNSIPVFIYHINYPFFVTTCSMTYADKINQYYADMAKRAEEYCHSVLYDQAVESAGYIAINIPPFNSYTFDVNYEITYNMDCITSLYMDTYTYVGGAHGDTKRMSDTWNFKTGNQLSLNEFFPDTSDFLLRIQMEIERQIEARIKENPGSYFDDYKILLRNLFNPDNFYLWPDRLTIYFQQYDIAPYSTGVPEFSFSFVK